MKHRILLAVFLLLNTPAWAQPPSSRFDAPVRGLAGVERLVPPSAAAFPGAGRKLNLRFSTYLAGVGLAHVHFDRERAFRVRPTFSGVDGLKPDNAKPRLLRGRVRLHGASGTAAGALIRLKDQPVLVVNFAAPGGPRRQGNYYRLEVPLQRARPFRARVQRLSRFAPIRRLDNDAVVVPAPSAVPASRANLRMAGSELKVLELNLDADREWYQTYGADSNVQISAFVNAAEAIYEEQLGITFDIVRQNVSTTLSFNTTDAEALLPGYANYVSAQPYYGNADAYHLFTGAELSASALGISYLATICWRPHLAFLLSRAYYESLVPIVFAHELAHSFNAEHIETNPPSIMNSGLGNPPPQTFAQTSINQIESYLGTHGSCLTDAVPTPTPTPTQTPTADPTAGPTTTATATPTPTPSNGIPGSGGGSGGDPKEGIMITLATRLNKQGHFAATIRLTDPRPDCTVRLLGSTNRTRIVFGEVVASYQPNELEQTLEGAVQNRVSEESHSGKKQDLWLAADIKCPSGAAGLSAVKRLKPYQIKGGKAVSLRKWLLALRGALQNA